MSRAESSLSEFLACQNSLARCNLQNSLIEIESTSRTLLIGTLIVANQPFLSPETEFESRGNSFLKAYVGNLGPPTLQCGTQNVSFNMEIYFEFCFFRNIPKFSRSECINSKGLLCWGVSSNKTNSFKTPEYNRNNTVLFSMTEIQIMYGSV